MPNHLYDALLGSQGGDDRPFLTVPDGAVLSYGELVALSGTISSVRKIIANVPAMASITTDVSM